TVNSNQTVLDVTAGTTVVSAGKTLNANSIVGDTLQLNANAKAIIKANGGAAGTVRVKHLSMSATAALDLKYNDLVVAYGTSPSVFSTIRDLVFSGYASSPDASKTGI